ncbi:helix-turn-helix domain-containing protein [Candidatus Woesearchaeota archaeon]|nr:helix-turn-helix domain-containing protein [Candidatus Woesearchaeota archaeon]
MEDFFDDFEKDFEKMKKGSFEKKEHIAFETLGLLKQYLTPERIKLLRMIKTKKPKSLYELARIAKRPLKSINRDVAVLKEAGLVEVKKNIVGRPRTKPMVNYDRINIAIEI